MVFGGASQTAEFLLGVELVYEAGDILKLLIYHRDSYLLVLSDRVLSSSDC